MTACPAHATLQDMTAKLSAQILILLSMAFGITVAVLAIVGSDAVALVAFLGASVLGLLWVARGFFAKRPGS